MAFRLVGTDALDAGSGARQCPKYDAYSFVSLISSGV